MGHSNAAAMASLGLLDRAPGSGGDGAGGGLLVESRGHDVGRRRRDDVMRQPRRHGAMAGPGPPQRPYQVDYNTGSVAAGTGRAYGGYRHHQAGPSPGNASGAAHGDRLPNTYPPAGATYFQPSMMVRPPPGVHMHHHAASPGSRGPYAQGQPHSGLATSVAATHGAIGSSSISGMPVDGATGQRMVFPGQLHDNAGNMARAGGAGAPPLPPGVSPSYASGSRARLGERAQGVGGYTSRTITPSPVQQRGSHQPLFDTSGGLPTFYPRSHAAPGPPAWSSGGSSAPVTRAGSSTSVASSPLFGYSRSGSYSS